MAAALDILADDLTALNAQGPAFVTLGEVMVRDTPADDERIERTRLVAVFPHASSSSVRSQDGGFHGCEGHDRSGASS